MIWLMETPSRSAKSRQIENLLIMRLGAHVIENDGNIAGRNVRRAMLQQCRFQGRAMTFEIEIDCEVDGRWIAEVPELAGVLTYGATRKSDASGDML